MEIHTGVPYVTTRLVQLLANAGAFSILGRGVGQLRTPKLNPQTCFSPCLAISVKSTSAGSMAQAPASLLPLSPGPHTSHAAALPALNLKCIPAPLSRSAHRCAAVCTSLRPTLPSHSSRPLVHASEILATEDLLPLTAEPARASRDSQNETQASHAGLGARSGCGLSGLSCLSDAPRCSLCSSSFEFLGNVAFAFGFALHGTIGRLDANLTLFLRGSVFLPEFPECLKSNSSARICLRVCCLADFPDADSGLLPFRRRTSNYKFKIFPSILLLTFSSSETPFVYILDLFL